MNFNLKGDGNIYVIGILTLVMAAAFALTSGLRPQFDETPTNAQEVFIDVDSINKANEDSLQLVDLKILITPTPRVSPTLSATPTQPPAACLNRTVITLVIDLSESMGASGKIGALQDAMEDFTTTLNTNTVIGGVAFGGESLSFANTEGVAKILDYTVYGTNQTNVNNILTGLIAGPEGGTFMRNGFQVALNRLRDAKLSYQGYRHIAIVVSDGVPEMYDSRTPTCLGGGYRGDTCWARQQDPRSTIFGLTSTDLTTQLKSEVESVYSVGIYDSTPGTRHAAFTQDFNTLLRTIASGNSAPFYQAIDLRTGAARDLTSHFRSIITDVCK